MSSSKINIFRHTDHLGNVCGTGLTEEGILEAREIGKRVNYPQERKDWIAISPDTKRHLGTVALAMDPSMRTEEVRSTAEEKISSGKIIIDNDLTYEPVKGLLFTKKMNKKIQMLD